MTPRQAAQLIGCSPQQVRTLIRRKRLKARPMVMANGQPCYDIHPAEVDRYLRQPRNGQSWRRGVKSI